MDRVAQLKAQLPHDIRRDQAWLRLLQEYPDAAKMTDLLVVNRPLTKHERHLLVPFTLPWGRNYRHLDRKSQQMATAISRGVVHTLTDQLADQGIHANAEQSDLRLGGTIAPVLVNKWYRQFEPLGKNGYWVWAQATVNVPRRVRVAGTGDIYLPARWSDIGIRPGLTRANVTVTVTGATPATKRFVSYRGRAMDAEEAYDRHLASFQDQPWYRKMGALVPTPFDDWVDEQRELGPIPGNPRKLWAKPEALPSAVRDELTGLAITVETQFHVLWDELLQQPPVTFGRASIKFGNQR